MINLKNPVGLMTIARTAALGVFGLAMSQAMHSTTAQTNTVSTGFAGGGQFHNNHQPGLGINYIVATQGTYPSRNADPGDVNPSNSDPYLGEIMMFAGNFAPRGFQFANGQLLDVSTNTALFSLYGTTFGGDGRTTFGLPDLRGRSAMHYGNGPGLNNYNLGAKSGVDNVTLSTAQLPVHGHTVQGLDPTTNVGSNLSHFNMKPYQAINFNLITQGTYPSRNAGAGTPSPNSSNNFIGFVEMFGGNFAPRNSLQTDGQLLPTSGNDALFSIIGTTYGGDGRTTFGVPDFRGRLVAHEGQGIGLSNYRSLGEKDGVENVTLTNTQMPNHEHAPSAYIGHTGGGQAHENMQPTNTLNYIIATQGLFPSRNADPGDVVQNAAEPFLGEIAMFAGNFAPRGWAFADGAILPINQNQSLYSLLGTAYGGDGRTSFALPDLRGRVPVHVGGSTGTGPGLRNWDLGEKFGTETHTLTTQQMPSHNHTFQTPRGFSDLDFDGDVDDADFGILFSEFTGPNTGPPNNPLADLDGDGDVDDADFGIAFSKFTGPGGGNGSNVPEPTTALLLVLGAAGLMARRSRRAG